jgi:hypothetical protein
LNLNGFSKIELLLLPRLALVEARWKQEHFRKYFCERSGRPSPSRTFRRSSIAAVRVRVGEHLPALALRADHLNILGHEGFLLAKQAR